MAIFLIFYKWAIEDVTMHRFKRGYLLGALIISFLIPISPTGYSYATEASLDKVGLTEVSILEVTDITQEITEPVSSIPLADILSIIFLLISGIYFIRFFRNISVLTHKATVNQNKRYHTAQLVLTQENIPPHTFLNKIYINKQDYLNGQIDEQLLVHERAHADQRHSWDIIFIELLMCLFWFNPLFRMYKTAIQLNHEFLADETVVKQFQQVKKYQYLLLDTIKNNNQISLASSINFSLTKKRLEMMTHKSTARRKNLLVLSILPMILILLVALGSPIIAQTNPGNKTIQAEDMNALRDAFFKNASIHYIDKDGLVYVKKFNAIPDYIKSQLMIPPPPPMTPANKSIKHPPLPEGTIVSLKENGTIHIGGDGNVPPPPPPAPPKAPNKVKGIGVPPPPPAPPAPPAPPKKVKDLAEQGVSIYINGNRVFDHVAKTICEDLNSETMKLKTEVDGTQSLYIVDKD